MTEERAARARWWCYFLAHPLRVALCAHRGHPERCERRIFEASDPLTFEPTDQPAHTMLAGADVRMLGERRACRCGLYCQTSFRRDISAPVADHMVACSKCELSGLCPTGEAIRRLMNAV